MCIVKLCAQYKCSMFNFLDSYDIKLQSLQLIINTAGGTLQNSQSTQLYKLQFSYMFSITNPVCI